MSDGSIPADVDQAILEIQKGEDADIGAVRMLVNHSAPTIDPSLLAIATDKDAKFDVAALASRILVERDPDRDPAFLYEYFPEFKQPPGDTSGLIAVVERFRLYPPAGAHQFGFTRLNRLQPVELFAKQLGAKFTLSRIAAAVSLGDTADLAALNALSSALADPSWRVRRNAADSVRRLRHAGAGEVLSTHPVRDALVACLGDRRRVVRVAAARALGSMGDLEPLRTYRAGLGWWAWRRRRDVDEVLRGEIPLLPKIWPGDETM